MTLPVRGGDAIDGRPCMAPADEAWRPEGQAAPVAGWRAEAARERSAIERPGKKGVELKVAVDAERAAVEDCIGVAIVGSDDADAVPVEVGRPRVGDALQTIVFEARSSSMLLWQTPDSRRLSI